MSIAVRRSNKRQPLPLIAISSLARSRTHRSRSRLTHARRRWQREARGLRVSVAGGMLVAVLMFAAPRVEANHIPGATYNGTVAGGSAISFAVSADGAGITSFSAPGPLAAGASCEFTGVTWTYSGLPLPITNHAFSDTDDPTMTLIGSFPTVQGAQGTMRVRDSSDPSCDTGELAWTATTTATPPPPPDTTAPAVQLSGGLSQKVLRQRGVLVSVASPTEASTVTAKGKVTVRGSGKVLKLTPVTKQIAQGGKATLKLKLKRTALKAIGLALKAGKKVSAKVTVTAKDTAGNFTTKRRTIKLKR